MNFEEWMVATFGSDFINTDPVTYFGMSAAWDAALEHATEAPCVTITGEGE